MFQTLLRILLPRRASSRGERLGPGDVRLEDPKGILFSLPTICDPAPEVDSTPPPSGARFLHEDDWRQIEFVAGLNHAHIQKELAALNSFKQEHWSDPGWTQVYVREEHPTLFSTVRLQFSSLPSFPVSGLSIRSGPPWGGTVRGGFALSDSGDWFIYGQRTEEGHVIQLAVSPGRAGPSEQFASALTQIAQSGDLVLVDWYASSIVDTSSPETVLAWARRYQ